jgi:hypothetical protein
MTNGKSALIYILSMFTSQAYRDLDPLLLRIDHARLIIPDLILKSRHSMSSVIYNVLVRLSKDI